MIDGQDIGEQDIHKETEERSPITIVRFSEKDVVENDPYFGSPLEGFEIFKDLINRQRLKYPDKKYPGDDILDRIHPETTDHRHLTTYIAYDSDEPIGGILGDDKGFGELHGKWFIIDPKYSRGETAKKLIEVVGTDYRRITLLASTFAGKIDATPERQISRQNALEAYYQKLGFKIDTNSESYKYASMPGAPMPMVWERPETAA